MTEPTMRCEFCDAPFTLDDETIAFTRAGARCPRHRVSAAEAERRYRAGVALARRTRAAASWWFPEQPDKTP